MTVLSTKEPLVTVDTFLREFRCDWLTSRGVVTGTRAIPTTLHDACLGPPMPPRVGGANDRSNRFLGGTGATSRNIISSPSSAGTRAGADGIVNSPGRPTTNSRIWTRPAARSETGLTTASVASGASLPLRPPAQFPASTAVSRGGGVSRGTFVDGLIASASTPGQMRTEALGILARVGRSYSSHLYGGRELQGNGTVGGLRNTGVFAGVVEGRQHHSEARWSRASGVLLQCFADPDQNLRLHALKVLEALLLERAERAEKADANRSETSTNVEGSIGTEVCTGAEPPHAKHPSEQLMNGIGALSLESTTSARGFAVTGDIPALAVAHEGVDGDGNLLGDLIQKHLQRALEDPYHGVRAIACSCHGSLLDSDWAAFRGDDRERCLNRLLAATRDRAAGE